MKPVERVLQSLEKGGLLLVQDKAFPSVVSLVTGERVAGSWWAHPDGKAIFRCLCRTEMGGDVLVTRLLAGKVTLLHRRLWPAVFAVAQAREPWQLRGLSPRVRSLWLRVEDQGSVVTSGPIAKEIQVRLLAHGNQVHTDSGRHEICLESWRRWSRRVGCATDLSPAEGRTALEEAVTALGGSIENLPWRQGSLGTQSRRTGSGT
jgi:hypothetical protein